MTIDVNFMRKAQALLNDAPCDSDDVRVVSSSSETCVCPSCKRTATEPAEIEFIGWFGLCIDCEWSRLDA